MTVVKSAKRKPVEMKVDLINIEVVENGYRVQLTYAYDTQIRGICYVDKVYVFDSWGDVSDFVRKANDLVKTFKVNKNDY